MFCLQDGAEEDELGIFFYPLTPLGDEFQPEAKGYSMAPGLDPRDGFSWLQAESWLQQSNSAQLQCTTQYAAIYRALTIILYVTIMPHNTVPVITL